jgi:hypothetical protein
MDKNRPPKPPSILHKDNTGKLVDPDEPRRLNDELLKKLITEQRAHEKDESFHVSRTGKRDVAVHMAVTILPRVNGKTVIGEAEREYNQWCFVIPAQKLPMHPSTCNQAFRELVRFAVQALMSLGMLIPK